MSEHTPANAMVALITKEEKAKAKRAKTSGGDQGLPSGESRLLEQPCSKTVAPQVLRCVGTGSKDGAKDIHSVTTHTHHARPERESTGKAKEPRVENPGLARVVARATKAAKVKARKVRKERKANKAGLQAHRVLPQEARGQEMMRTPRVGSGMMDNGAATGRLAEIPSAKEHTEI